MATGHKKNSFAQIFDRKRNMSFDRVKKAFAICNILALFISSYAPPVLAEKVRSQSTVVEDKTPSVQSSSPKQVIQRAYVPKKETALSIKNLTIAETGFSLASAAERLPIQVQEMEKDSFGADEMVHITINNPDRDTFTTKVIDATGEKSDAAVRLVQNGSETDIKIDGANHLVPGKYTVEITDSAGNKVTQDFTWGVLALNTDKAIYKPNETAAIAIAVLDDKGEMVCNADVTLRIINDKTKVSEVRSTANGNVIVNDVCHSKAFTLTPDYETSYVFQEVGTYTLHLQASSPRGTYEITEKVEVKESTPFDIKRTSSTRLYPPLEYPMNIEVTATEDFTGTITETVPDSFIITPADGNSNYDTTKTVYRNGDNPEVSLQASVLGDSTSRLEMPFDGSYVISQGFGSPHTDASLREFYARYGLAGHDGIDFALPMGTPLYAIDDGNVLVSGNGDYGITIILQHSWGRSYYGHLSKTNIGTSTSVKKGSLIGYSGNTGESTGPHLHFGMKPENADQNNGYAGKIDPMPYLSALSSDEQLMRSLQLKNVSAVLAATDSATATESASEPQEQLNEKSVQPTVEPTPTTMPTTAAPVASTSASVPAKPYTMLSNQIEKEVSDAESYVVDKVKVLKWDVSLKKGEKTTLSYAYEVPKISPQFYLLGSVKVFNEKSEQIFREGRKWHLAADAVGTDWYDYSYQYRKSITVDSTKVAQTAPGLSARLLGTANACCGDRSVSSGSPAEGELLVLSAQHDFTTDDLDPPDGTWTERTDGTSSPGRAKVWTKIAGASEPGTYTVGANGSGDVVIVLIGVTGADPQFDAANQSTGTGTSLAAPSVTTTADSAMLFNFWTIFPENTAGRTISEPGSVTTLANDIKSGDYVITSGSYEAIPTAGATGTRTATASHSEPWVASSVAIRDDGFAGGGGGGASDEWCNDASGITCDSNWTHRKKITINNSASSTNLTNFPLLVSLGSTDIDRTKTQVDGDDLRFVDPDDNTVVLDHEIENYDETGTDYVWVEVPQLDASSTTDYIWMYYNNASASSGANATGVWDSNYEAVYHMNTNPAATCTGSSEVCDSTSNANHGDSRGTMTSGDLVTGQIGSAIDFDGVDDAFQIPDSNSLDVSNLTVSLWVNRTTAVNGEQFVGRQSGTGAGDLWQSYASNLGNYYYNSTLGDMSSSSTAGDVGNWVYISHSYDGSNLNFYRNGALDDTRGMTGSLAAATTNICIASGANDATLNCVDEEVNGIFDEVRISSIGRSADWVEAEYLTMTDVMNSFGSEQSVDGSDPGTDWCNDASGVTCDTTWLHRKKITINNSASSEDLTDFPFLVKLDAVDIDRTKTQSDGDDLRFVDPSDNTVVLSHEIENYDESGSDYIWVKVPQIDANSTTDYIWMYYNNASASSGNDGTNVWDTNYKMVQHLHETSGTTSQDATTNNNDGTATGFTLSSNTGQVGGAQNFDGGTGGNDYITIANSATLENLTEANYTYSAWASPDTNPSGTGLNDYFVVGKRGHHTGLKFAASSTWFATVYNTSNTSFAANDSPFAIGTWRYVTQTVNTSSQLVSLYVDGVLQDTSTYTGTLRDYGTQASSIGKADIVAACSSDYAFCFDGKIDEVRMSNVERSANWIEAEYLSMTDALASYGSEEDQSGNGPSISNFPVLISLTSDSDLSSKAQPDGDDIVFTSSDGITKLAHEIESYSSGTLVAWVNIPALYLETDTMIYMYYGNPAATNQQNASNVWDTNYRSVWHLNELGNGTAGEYNDSTSVGNDGRGGNGTAANVPTRLAGQIGNGQDFDGSNDLISTSNTTIVNGTTAYTLEAWINADTCGEGGGGSILDKLSNFAFYVCQSTNNTAVEYDSAANTIFESAANSIALNSWYHVVAVYDGSGTGRMYVNGNEVSSDTSIVSPTNSNNVFVIGGDSTTTTTYTFDGTIDEVRVSDTARSREWLITEYNNQSSPSTFYAVGSEETEIYAPLNSELMRHGKFFDSRQAEQPFNF